MQQKSTIRTETSWISTAKWWVNTFSPTPIATTVTITPDTTYARFGVKGETQINSDLTGYGSLNTTSKRINQKANRVAQRVWRLPV
jgi:predicted porin